MNDQPNTTEAAAEAPKVSKSIVPARYAGKYKDGGTDALATFLNTECKGEQGFSYDKFFALCRANGLPEEKVAHYEGQVAQKLLGSQGRARMTLRNILATGVRKNHSILNLAGEKVDLELPKPALTGAAKAAKDKQETAEAAE